MLTESQALHILANVLRRHPLPERPADLPEADRARLANYAAEHGVSQEYALIASRRAAERSVECALAAEALAQEAREAAKRCASRG